MNVRRSASTRFAILGLLRLEPMSGYDVRRACEEALSPFWHESYGQIYPAIAALERERLIRPAPSPSPERSRRKVYAITPAGRRALAAWLKHAPRERPFRSELLLHLFFGDAASAPDLLAHVTRTRAEETARLASYRRLEQRMRREAKDSPSLPFWRATLRYGQLRSAAVVGWCDETLRALAAPGKKKGRRP
jgi:DNA-binding PadR family transcriptional regulator